MLYDMNNIITRFTYVFVILLVISIRARAQSSNDLGSLTLEQCIEIAQEQSAVSSAARYALISNRWQYKSYKADLLPSISLTGDAPNYDKSIFSNVLDNGEVTFSSRTQSEASASIAVEQNILPTGGTLSLSSGLTRLGIFEGENTYLWQSTPMVVGLRQPIFQFNNLKWRKKTETLQYEIAQKEYVEEMENIAKTVTQRFFDVYLAKINLQNAKLNVTQNDSVYQISKGRYKVGSIAENDLLQTELALRNAESNLTTARIEYERTLNEFKILLGYSTDTQLKLRDPKEPPKISVNIEKARQLALKNNSESLNYKLNEIQADRSLAQAKSEAGLSATLNVNYGLNQTARDFADLYDRAENRQFVTLGFDVPIFNWGKQKAQVNAARNQQREVANSVQFQRRQFMQQVDYTVSQFLQLRGQVLLAAKADTIAQRRYQVAQNRYKIGKIDITNLFIAQDEKDSARRAYIRALRSFWTGWYNLRELTLYDFKEDEPISYEL
ncbi:TolC family protein [Fodinibius halophilus]|uniref:TolC family protein n=1 Tax=Fodinibius halophilus TaxID=1736908 RepID=A0A6M1TFM4_9BACT|nr:TolC family protein [Fodinibius halophilus]NGP87440.1 TolC family protein [Fodinibius halophilus]